jgi:hypothetical protein
MLSFMRSPNLNAALAFPLNVSLSPFNYPSAITANHFSPTANVSDCQCQSVHNWKLVTNNE